MALEDYRKDMERCVRCSLCKFIPLEQVKGQNLANVCPSIARHNFHTYSGGGRLITALAMLKGRLDYTDKLLEIVYQCQTCGGCDISCKYGRDMEVLEPIYQFRIKCVEDGQFLPVHMLLIDGLRREDNMMQKPKAERGQWAEGLAVKDITRERAAVYYHAGCRYAFDQELWPAARGAVTILAGAGVDIGIAGKDEVCCGCRAYELGYQGEAVKYAEHNREMLKQAGVTTVVTSCSDCYYGFKVLYDKLGKRDNDLEVLHITEYLARLIKKGRIRLTRSLNMKVTYHDPCHLGRLGEPYIHWEGVEKKVMGQLIVHDPPKEYRRGTFGVYQPPRDVLKSIPALELVEMERIKEYAWCCGAGGGVKDAFPEFAAWTARERLREARATGAEALVTACPWCQRNFMDALATNGDGLKVYDIVGLVEEALGEKGRL
jgi:Fe-S oxidoreductase